MKDAQIYAALYGPTVDDLLRQLADVPESLSDRLSAFVAAPTPAAALNLARDLDGARTTLMRIHQRLQAGEASPLDGGAPLE